MLTRKINGGGRRRNTGNQSLKMEQIKRPYTINKEKTSKKRDNTKKLPKAMAQIKGLAKKKTNIGDTAEKKAKVWLFEHKGDTHILGDFFNGVINTSKGIEVMSKKGNPFADISNANAKASSNSKADVIVQSIADKEYLNISIKSFQGAPPSVINTTPRRANSFCVGGISDITHDDLKALDTLSLAYREMGGPQDKKFLDLVRHIDTYPHDGWSNATDVKNAFKKTLKYFIFSGTGRSLSDDKIDAIFKISKQNKYSLVDCRDEDAKDKYIDSVMDDSIISFRTPRGSPTKIQEELGKGPAWCQNDGDKIINCLMHCRITRGGGFSIYL